jgi:hypothetical protein
MGPKIGSKTAKRRPGYITTFYVIFFIFRLSNEWVKIGKSLKSIKKKQFEFMVYIKNNRTYLSYKLVDLDILVCNNPKFLHLNLTITFKTRAHRKLLVNILIFFEFSLNLRIFEQEKCPALNDLKLFLTKS